MNREIGGGAENSAIFAAPSTRLAGDPEPLRLAPQTHDPRTGDPEYA